MNESNGSGGSGGSGGKKLAVFAINEKEEGRAAWWQKIGTAFQNRDGSISIYLDALPLGTNKLQVREPRDDQGPRAANGVRRGAAGEAGEVRS